MGEYVKKKKNMNFQSVESLQQVVNVVNEAAAALYGLGTVGLSAAGITSGLAAAGSIVGGGMVAGVFVLAAPAVIFAAGGVGITSHLKSKQLKQEKERFIRKR